TPERPALDPTFGGEDRGDVDGVRAVEPVVFSRGKLDRERRTDRRAVRRNQGVSKRERSVGEPLDGRIELDEGIAVSPTVQSQSVLRLDSPCAFRQTDHVVPIVAEAVQAAAARGTVRQLELDRPAFRDTTRKRQSDLARFRIDGEGLVCRILYERRARPVKVERPLGTFRQPSAHGARQAEGCGKGILIASGERGGGSCRARGQRAGEKDMGRGAWGSGRKGAG